MKGFMTRGRDIIIPGCGETTMLFRGKTLAARRLHESRPIRNHPTGVGFPPRGAASNRGITVFFPGVL